MTEQPFRCPSCGTELEESERKTPNSANGKQWLKANFVCPKCKLGVNRQTLGMKWFGNSKGPDRDDHPDSMNQQAQSKADKR